MILPNISTWAYKSGKFIVWERLYYNGRWTPLCKVRIKGLKPWNELTKCELQRGLDEEEL